jgi:hypothetical protein
MPRIYKADIKKNKNIETAILHSIEGGRLLLFVDADGQRLPVYDANENIMSFMNIAQAREFMQPCNLLNVKYEHYHHDDEMIGERQYWH